MAELNSTLRLYSGRGPLQLTKAENDLKAQDTNVTNAQTQVTTLTNQKAAKPDDTEIAANLKKANEDLINAQAEQKKLQEKVETANSDLKKANQLVADIKETREGVLRQMSTSASIETGGDKEIKSHSKVKNLHDNSKENIAAVAIAVKEMVTEALNKDYSTEACLSYLGNEFQELEHAKDKLFQQTIKINDTKKQIGLLGKISESESKAIAEIKSTLKGKLETEEKEQQKLTEKVENFSKKIAASASSLTGPEEMRDQCLKVLQNKMEKRHVLDLRKLDNENKRLETEKLEREIEKVKLEKEKLEREIEKIKLEKKSKN